jgi:hypothetical protein
MCDKLNKKSKNAAVKPFMVKNHLWVFCNSQIVNPAFDSQARGGGGRVGEGHGFGERLRPLPARRLTRALAGAAARPVNPLTPPPPTPRPRRR